MPLMRTVIAIGLIYGVAPRIVSAQAVPADVVAPDLQPFQGNWTVVSAFVNGTPDDVRYGAAVTITNDILQGATTRGSASAARLSVQTSLTPKAIDIAWLDGQFRGEKFYGIYRFDGQRLYVCASRTGVTRPKKFESLPDRVESLVTFERIR